MSFIPTLDSVVSISNSSALPLASSATFTGVGEDVSDFSTIALIVNADNNGTVKVQFSSDNSNWDISNDFIVTASTALQKVIVITAKYYRVVYVNDAGAQTFFRLQTIQHKQKTQTSTEVSNNVAVTTQPTIEVSNNVDTTVTNTVNTNSLTNGTVSTVNSSTTPLSASATFTGTSEDVSNYSTLTFNFIADQNATVKIQFSSNGTNWDHEKEFPIVAGKSITKTIDIQGNYVRTVVDNDSTTSAMTYLRLQSSFHKLQAPNLLEQVPYSLLSNKNSSTTPLTGAATFTGALDNTTNPDLMISCKSDVAGTLYVDFSNDQTNWDTFPPSGFIVTGGIHEFHTALKGPRYFRVRYVNGASAQSYLRLYTYTGTFAKMPNAPVGFTIADDADAVVVKSVISGVGDTTCKVTNNKSLQVTVAPESKSAFGDILTTDLSPVIQMAFIYDFDNPLYEKRENNGTITVASASLSASTGAAANQSASMISTKRIKYEPGVGCRIRYSGLFSTGVANSTQLIGLGDESQGFFFGYNGTTFGVLHRYGGAPEIRTLTISTASSTAENITVTLDGDADATVAVTASANTTTTANEIAAHDYSTVGSGWTARAVGSTVVFMSWTSATQSGTYSISGTTVVGSFAQSVVGTVPTDNWIPQTSWNGDDKFDGSGLSGITIDPTKGNVYQIDYQYLGMGAISFFMEDAEDGELHKVHVIQHANANTRPSLDNPALPLYISAQNGSNTSDIIVKSSSMAGFIDGIRKDGGVLRTLTQSSTISSSGSTPFFSLRANDFFDSKHNLSNLKVVDVSAALEHTKPGTIEVWVNPTLTDASFTAVDANTSTLWTDTSATALTGGELIGTVPLGKSASGIIKFSFDVDAGRIEAGDTITLVLNFASGTNAEVRASLRCWEIN